MSASDPRAILRDLEQRARKRFGQHFLARPSLVARMVRGARVEAGDRVLEIGPGLGILTEALLAAEAEVTAVEIDDDLYQRVTEVYPEVRAVHADATKVDWSEVCPGEGWKAVANLPYNVGTHLVMAMVRQPERFTSVTVMLQAEVVARLAAVPSTKAYGALSVQAQARGQVRALFGVPPDAFVPPPRVWSTVVQVLPDPEPDLGGVSGKAFDRVVASAFSQRRKTLRNSLGALFGKDRAADALVAAGIDPGQRAESVPVDGYRRLAPLLAD
jgi:16S rRNA (adenine1518-N6/adenine1519-N6)-dimethyltransferase